MAPVFSRSAWLCAWHLIQDGGGRGKSSGQSKYSGGAFNITDFLHAFCGTSLLPLLHGLKMEVHIILSIFAAVAPPVVFRRKSLTGILPAVDPIGKNVLAGVFYFIGFGLFCLESVLSIWVIQQVYMYFRGGGKAAQMKQEAARGALTAAI